VKKAVVFRETKQIELLGFPDHMHTNERARGANLENRISMMCMKFDHMAIVGEGLGKKAVRSASVTRSSWLSSVTQTPGLRQVIQNLTFSTLGFSKPFTIVTPLCKTSECMSKDTP
jgi:hypothetical protein